MTEDTYMPLGPFPDTQWSLVFRAGQGEQDRRQALGEFLQRYLPALKAHLVLRKKVDRDRANDRIQGFAADRLVAGDLLRHVASGNGELRTFLLIALDNYVMNQVRREAARKRSPGWRRGPCPTGNRCGVLASAAPCRLTPPWPPPSGRSCACCAPS